MLNKIIITFIFVLSTTCINGMDHDMLNHWGSGKYKVINFSEDTKNSNDFDTTKMTCQNSDFVFISNEINYKTCMCPVQKRTIPKKSKFALGKHYICINLNTGKYNEWHKYRSSHSRKSMVEHLVSLGGTKNDSYQINSKDENVTLNNSPFYIVNAHDICTRFYETMLHRPKNIMLSQTRNQNLLISSWQLFCIQPPYTGQTYKTPMYAQPMGTIEELDYEKIDTACFTPDGKTLFVFLKNGIILKIIPEALTRVTPKAYDMFFRWK